MKDNEHIIRKFIAAWSRLDVEELLSYFAEDATYHNMPIHPVTGRDAIRHFIEHFSEHWTATSWDLLNIVSKGDLVIAERVDRTQIGDKSVELPGTGVFEMEDGKIKVWRDYFDLNTYLKAVA